MTKQAKSFNLAGNGKEITTGQEKDVDSKPGKSNVIKMSWEQLRALPAMKSYYKILRFMEEHSDKPIILSEKHLEVHKERLPHKFETWRNLNPNLTLHEALTLLLQDLPPVFSTELLNDILAFAIQHWEQVNRETEVLETA